MFTDAVFWGFIGAMVGWHTPAPVWATWVWDWAKEKVAAMTASK